jgi:hypothetical protein
LINYSFNSIKGALDGKDISAGNMGVTFSCAQIGMTKKGLDVTNVGTAFKKMGGEGMAKAVNGNILVNPGMADCFIKNLLG